MPNNDQQNPKKVAEHTTKSINAKKEETRKNENAKSLVQPQQDNKTNHSETIDKTPTIHNNGYSYHETPSTDVKSNEDKQIDS
ncbi:hypothetical protein BUY69_11870, partial [Staphylococcus epidermidis]